MSTPTATNTLLEAALALHDAGCAVVPARANGSKAPAGNWKQHQTARPTRAQVIEWFSGSDYDGFGIITGAVSGNLEMFELEGRATAQGLGSEIAELADNCDLGELWRRVCAGYLEATPSAGIHVLYRIEDAPVGGNTKLARDADNQVLIETRGEGGFTICAPSGGRTHPDGGTWRLLSGGPASIATITADERDALYALARAMDKAPQRVMASAAPPAQRSAGDHVRPGDDYNARASWDAILDGWARVYTDSHGVTYWCRPGKRWGISATTGRPTRNGEADNLFVFTTSTSFESEVPYSKFGAYAHLHHNGDLKAAAKQLAADGYGEGPSFTFTLPTQEFVPEFVAPAAVEIEETDGSLAVVHQLQPRDPDLTFSDDGNALALIAAHGQTIRFCHERNRWLHWDGQRWQWQPASGGYLRELVKGIARSYGDSGQEGSHKRKTLASNGTTAALMQASTDPRIVVSIDDLDAQPWELNTPGGIIDLRTGQLHPNDPAKLHTRITACTPDLGADQSQWSAFLADTFGADQALIAYLQRLVGYSSVGMVGPHVLPFCHGSGGNGKGVFLETCAGVLGDYATTAPVGFLMKRMSGHETEIARLAGARFVICSEVNEDDVFDEAKVKQLTGGDSLTARFMRQDHFTFTPSHQLWLMGNTQPTVRTGGRSFWRRLRMIPFDHEVAEENVVDDLQGLLTSEHGPAVLGWIVAGAAAYHANGLQDPETVKAATADYAVSQDTVARFVDERIAVGGGEYVKIKTSVMREAYEQWCRAEGVQPVTAHAFTKAVKRFGIDGSRSHGVRYYTNASLLNEDEEVAPAEWGSA